MYAGNVVTDFPTNFYRQLSEIACPTKWLIHNKQSISHCYSGSIVQSKCSFKCFRQKNATKSVDGCYKKPNR